MFNIGELKVTVENSGMTSKEYIKLHKLRCKMKVQSSKEYLYANRETESENVKFLIFSRRNIHLDNVVIYKNEVYNIKHISPYGNGYVDLICEVKR
ncbi:MAG: phage head closure protein [Clostridia bacterium]